jgi:heme-degrading monooxygenase HmoA
MEDPVSSKSVARVATSKIHSAKIEAGVMLWEKHVIPAMKAAAGFRHVYVLGDDKAGTVMTISMWDTEAHASAWEKSETQQSLRTKLAEHVTSMPTPEAFHVKLEG